MGCRGRLFAVGIVCLFNVIRYFYYHQYLGLHFEANFFILTAIFTSVAWWCGKQYDQAKYYSEKDPLTNTYNRRTIDQSFQKLSLRCQKDNKRLGVMVIDLDNFKEVNDRFGHLEGDRLLQYVSFVLKKIMKKEDFIARWGGDEFLLLIPNIKEDIGSHYVQLLQTELMNHDYNSIPLPTASVGVAIYPDQGRNFETLIQQADAEMYRFKEMKRLVGEEFSQVPLNKEDR